MVRLALCAGLRVRSIVGLNVGDVNGKFTLAFVAEFKQKASNSMNPQNWLQLAMDLVVAYGPRLLGAIVAIVLTFVAANWAKRFVVRNLTGKNFDATLTRFFGGVVRTIILVAAGLGILGVFGIQTTAFAAVLGAAGLAVGLAFQGTLGNFAAGVMLLVFRPYKVGDLVEVGEELGLVEELGLFTTDLKSLDNRAIIVPNGKIFGEKIINLGQFPVRRVDVSVGAEYAADIDATRAALEGCVEMIPHAISEPAPQIFLKQLGASSVDWEVRVWCKSEDYWDTWQEAVRAAKLSLDAAKIGIPFPQLDIHVPSEAANMVSWGPSDDKAVPAAE